MPEIDLLAAARRAPEKQPLRQHRDAVRVLRKKGYAWRDIAAFFAERGIPTDHTTLYRTFKELPTMMKNIDIPDSATYAAALRKIGISDAQRKMLMAHYNAHNRSITFGELAEAAGRSNNKFANSEYGKLGHKLGNEMGFEFNTYLAGAKVREFYSSVIGMQNPYRPEGEFHLLMHHELAKAIATLGWS